MEFSRRNLVPVSWLFGSYRSRANFSDPLSAVPLRHVAATLDEGALRVSGSVHHGEQTLGQHLWSDGPNGLAFTGDIYNLAEIMKLGREVLGRRRVDSIAHLLWLLISVDSTALFRILNGKLALAHVSSLGLILVRDHVGEEQLYYASTSTGVVFSSSIRPVAIAVGAEFFVPDAVLLFETPVGDETMFRGVRKLTPGTAVTFGPDQRSQVNCYWQLGCGEPLSAHDTEIAEAFRESLGSALALRRPTLGRFGTFLSGGQDSSWVACSLARAGTSPGRAYTTAFREMDSVYDESAYAALVAREVGAEHVILAPTADDFVEHYPQTMAILDEVKANAAHFNEYWIAKAAAELGETVLFSGYGADEALGGEIRYVVMYLYRDPVAAAPLFSVHPLLRSYRPLFERLHALPAKTRAADKYFHLIRRGSAGGSDSEYRELVRGAFTRATSLVDQMGLTDIEISGPPLLDSVKLDKYWGIDKICPFLDRHVLSFAFRLPEHLKISNLTTKKILRDISRGLVPDAITDRTEKVGFAFPHNHPRYSGFIRVLAEQCRARTGRRLVPDQSRGRFDRTLLMAASEELVRSSYEERVVATRFQ